jgi:iron complex outermembrane receptor protein
MFEKLRASCHPRSLLRVPVGPSAAPVFGLFLGFFAAAPTAALQIPPGDTIPLAPVEVSVLRTPVLESASPLAIATLSGEDLQRGRSGFFLDQALFGLPGVQVQNRYNPAVGERVAIRGFGARAQFGLRGIRVIVDGIPATLPDGQSSLDHLDVGSLERVEVIRGPASALFGNASGGVLSFTTSERRLAA